VPYRIALEVRTAHGDQVSLEPADGGPFSWHDPATVTTLLTSAGWHDVDVTRHEVVLPFAGGVDAGTAAEAALDFGPTRLAMAGADDVITARVRDAIAAAFAEHLDENGHVALGAQINIVTARR